MLMGQDQSHLATMARKITTSSAMNPALMLCLMVCPLGIIGISTLFHVGLWIPAVILIVLTGFPLGIAGWQLIHFTKHDPNRLQGEQHVERMLQIRQAVAFKDGGELKEVTVSGDLVSNPALEDKSGE